jgi:pimeloyl-ACP methyl ester carboxylesterase
VDLSRYNGVADAARELRKNGGGFKIALRSPNGPFLPGSTLLVRRTGALIVASFLAATAPLRADCFIRGDANADGRVDITDSVFTLASLFLDGPETTCADAQDANDDGRLDLTDVIFALGWRYVAIGSMPAPYPDCGVDPTGDLLGCAVGACPRDEPTAMPDRVFVLKTARVGLPYRASLPEYLQEMVLVYSSGKPPETLRDGIAFRGYCAMSDSLPAGLEMDEAGGAVSGVPEEAGFFSLHLIAVAATGEVVRFRADLAVFGEAEEEIVPGQALEEPGPHPVGVAETEFPYTHFDRPPPPYEPWNCMIADFPDQEYRDSKRIRVYYPDDIVRPAPALIFHHGFGFSYQAYESLLGHLASHGFVVATVSDEYSYGSWAILCGLAQEEAARVMLATRDVLGGLSSSPGGPLFRKVDISRIFYGGHSRGGGSAILAAELDPRTSGVIALEPTDPKEDAWIGNTSRMDMLPEVPILIITAEQDADVTFPYAERLFERIRGAGTMVSIYGSCHGFTADGAVWCPNCEYAQETYKVDACPYIPRKLHQDLTGKFAAAFLRRHGSGDLSLEGTLYGDEFERSPLVSLASRRNMGSAIVVDDFGRFPTNSLGLSTNWFGDEGTTAAVGSSYDWPALAPPEPFPPIDNLVLGLPMAGAIAYRSSLGAPNAGLKTAPRRRLLFRIQNVDRPGLVDDSGLAWLNLSVTLTDTAGRSATVPLGDRLPAERFHPSPDPPEAKAQLKYQRPITVAVPLADFAIADPDLDLDSLLSVEWRFVSVGNCTIPPHLGLDEIRFE